MSEHKFPWRYEHIIIVTFAKDEPAEIEIFRCHVGEHGALFPEGTTFLSVIEQGWIPFAWCEDDSPVRDDKKYPPMWTDYLTEER